MISEKSIDLIIEFEVSSKEYYVKYLQKPEWPGLNSGITVGIGYDLGYSTPQEIERDWRGPFITLPIINAMKKYSGITREKAKALLPQARREITVSWDAAYSVFIEKSIPQWIEKVKKALPNCDKLNDDCLGVLVSLAYNRGPAFNAAGDKYLEMRNIKTHMEKMEFHKIPKELRDMKRLWPTTQGLIIRREKEARLFELGLNKEKVVTKPAETPKTIPATDAYPAPIPQSPKPSLWNRISNNIFAKIMK